MGMLGVGAPGGGGRGARGEIGGAGCEKRTTPRHHPRGVRGKQQSHNLQPRLRANGGKAVGASGDYEWIGLLHISIIAEIRNRGNFFFSETLSSPSASYFLCATFL